MDHASRGRHLPQRLHSFALAQVSSHTPRLLSVTTGASTWFADHMHSRGTHVRHSRLPSSCRRARSRTLLHACNVNGVALGHRHGLRFGIALHHLLRRTCHQLHHHVHSPSGAPTHSNTPFPDLHHASMRLSMHKHHIHALLSLHRASSFDRQAGRTTGKHVAQTHVHAKPMRGRRGRCTRPGRSCTDVVTHLGFHVGRSEVRIHLGRVPAAVVALIRVEWEEFFFRVSF